MGDYLCIGDFICLYCVDTDGYVFNAQSSSVHNGLHIYHDQDRESPNGIPNVHAITFQVCIQNRYKSNKHYRSLLAKSQRHENDLHLRAQIPQAKKAALAEDNDNIAEQKRQHGKRVRYGETIQLKHVFTWKYIHISTTQGSVRDKNNMLVSLYEYNAKQAQFRVQPRYKVKSEGDNVQIYDQIVLESVKSPGQYFHASMPCQIDTTTFGSELNLGIERTGFTIMRSYKPTSNEDGLIRGGSCVRLFHRELEAYLTTEGLFDDLILQDVHLRVRQIDQINNPKTLLPSTSGVIYWQIEAENSVINGGVIRWGQQVRLRHMVTRQYLCLSRDMKLSLTNEFNCPKTVFRLHPVKKELDEIKFEAYARIEHELTGRWLHALKNEIYEPRDLRSHDLSPGVPRCPERMLAGLTHDDATLCKVTTELDQRYDDAFSLQMIEPEYVTMLNYVAGCVPFLKNIIGQLRTSERLLASDVHKITKALDELRAFLHVNGIPDKPRQKLLRNLRILDLVMELLQFPLKSNRDRIYLTTIFKSAYELLHAYMAGQSRKNALYMAKYIGFFYTQLNQQGDIGLHAAQMVMELIKDNRKVVDKLNEMDIDIFVSLLKKNKNYRYLDMLNVLCVCDGVALPDNQNYICRKWLSGDKSGLLLLDSGLNICRETRKDITYISSDNGRNWLLLHEFCDRTRPGFSEEDYQFLLHQLDLLGKLSYGGNDYAIHTITERMKLVTWEQAFYCLRQEDLPEDLRAQYCALIIGLFVNSGVTRTTTDNISLAFVYEDVDRSGSIKRILDNTQSPRKYEFDPMREWITSFFEENCGLVANRPNHNLLIAQILRLVLYLVKYGYYGSSSDIRRLLRPLLNLLDGRHDRPVQEHPGHSDKDIDKLVKHYQKHDRFEKSAETSAIVAVKLQAMEILDLLFTFQYHTTLEGFIAAFKNIESKARLKRVFSALSPMLTETFDASREPNACRRALKKLEDLFDKASFFDKQQITDILMDLGSYNYDRMVTNAMNLLNKFYSAKADLFKRAVFSQVLITKESSRVHKQVQESIPTLKRLINSRLNEEQAKRVVTIFEQLAEFCHMSPQKDKPHPMNQTILINHGILCVIFDMLSHNRDVDLSSTTTVARSVVRKSLRCLMFLANGNDHVRKRVYDKLDLLMSLKGVEQDVALCLKMAFQDSESLCLKVQAYMIERMVKVAAEHREKAPAVLELLRTLVKVPDLDLPLKRNQMYVMKYIMHNFHRAAYAIDQSREVREEILTNKYGPHHLRYMVVLVDLLATCAEGENRFIESLCQKFMKLEDVFWVLNHTEVDNNLKSPFLKYLLWVYMNTAGSMIESGAGELPHETCTWEYLSQLVNDINQMTVFAVEHKDLIEMLLTKPPTISQVADVDSPAEIIRSNLHYIFDGVMPFLRVFFRKFYSVDKDLFPDEAPIVDKLAHALMVFSEAIGFLIHNPSQMRSLVSCALSIVPMSSLPTRVLEEFLDKFGTGHLDLQDNGDSEAYKEYNCYYRDEEELNAKLHTYAANFRMVYGGENTVGAQLKHANPGARRREYTDIGGDEELPLGEEFQDFVSCFVTPHAATIDEKYEKADILLDQLVISFSRSRNTEEKRLGQEDLDIKCLQLLRAIIHNEERRIPQNWKKNSHKAKSQLAVIADLQSAFNQKEALWKVLPHVARQNDFLVKEVLSFISAMLFNANTESQKSMWEYFLSTREENFFFAIKTRMQISATAAKEKRALLSQHRAKTKEADAHAESLQVSMTQGRLALQRLQLMENTRRRTRQRTTSIFQRTPPPIKVLPSSVTEKSSVISLMKGKPVVLTVNGKDTDHVKVRDGSEVKFRNGSEVNVTEEVELMELKVDDSTKTSSSMSESGDPDCQDTAGVDLQSGDDGYIELVLRVLARMCDGQYKESQDYLREQPDNIKSFNLIAETVQYLSQHYANISASSINLVVQLLDCLNECIVGNGENRAVVFDNKIVDYVNFILRTGQYRSCSLDKALQLLEIIGNLLMSLVEENSPAAFRIAKEIADCLDKDAIRRVLCDAYHQSREPETGGLAAALKLAKSAQTQAIAKTKKLSQKQKHNKSGNHGDEIPGQKSSLPDVVDTVGRQTATAMLDVGFKYYFLYQRIKDISPKIQEKRLTEQELVANEFYEKNSMSIELVKEGHLQKVRFRVENKNVLRKEVKEKLKWEVDRSSPSSKIRDLMAWSQDILNDISYQRKVLNNKLAFFFMQFWLFWNYGAILLSLTINILMLATWQAPMAMTESMAGNATLPASLYDPHPTIAFDDYQVVKYSLSGVHNLLSVFVLVSFFLLNHPRPPNIRCRPCWPSPSDQFAPLKMTQKPDDSKLETHLFSFKTLYYFLFLAFSVLGTAFSEYFFCFHLLNIVNNNQLLDRVIKAVTTNGKSLLWVGVLGVVIFYIYALIAFAFLRSSFNPGENWYCSNLFECFITIVRYGLVGDMFENMPIHQADAYFSRFGIYVLFNVSFFIFITTIGLNIIFGIIVDTFSELRDLKWTAEKDMRDTCFICSRSSYDFEHYGKGFVYHVRNEHNMWAYIFFFIHLNDTKPTDYTAIELYVHKLLQRQNYDFFPTNRALCLQDIENDQQDSKFDELLHYVSSIFHKQKDEETRKKHDEERLHQQRWEEENRNLIYGNDSSVQAGTLGVTTLQLQPLSPSMGPLHSPHVVVQFSDPDEMLTDPFLEDDDDLSDFDADLDSESTEVGRASEAETVSIQQAVEAIPVDNDEEDIPSGQVTRF